MLGLQFSRAMIYHGRGDHLCHPSDDRTLLKEDSVLDHILGKHHQQLHLNSSFDSSELLRMLTIFAQSDAAATIYFTTQFVWLLFESGI